MRVSAALDFNATVADARRRRSVRMGWRDASPRLRCDRMCTKVDAYKLQRCVRIVYFFFFAFFGAFLLINFRPVSFVYDLLTCLSDAGNAGTLFGKKNPFHKAQSVVSFQTGEAH
jgi:hypothetical protein